MIILFIIFSIISIWLLIAYGMKKTIFQHLPWLWENIGKPLRDYMLVTSVRKITLAYFSLVSGLSVSLPLRKFSACVANGESIGWLSVELDDSNIDLYTCITIVAATVAYVWFLKYETAVLNSNNKSWIDKLMKKIDDAINFLSLIALSKKGCQVRFADGSSEIVINPLFKMATYKHKEDCIVEEPSADEKKKRAMDAVIQGSLSSVYMQSIVENSIQRVQPLNFYVCIGKELKSYAPIKVSLMCTNRDPLDDVYLQIEADNNAVEIIDTNRDVNTLNTDMFALKKRLDNRRVEDNKVKVHIPYINGGMEYHVETFYVKAPHDCKAFNLIWRLNARSYQQDGTLHVSVNPRYVHNERTSCKDIVGTVIEDYEEDIIQE